MGGRERGGRRALRQGLTALLVGTGLVMPAVATAPPAWAVTVFSENFDGVTPPALPGGWVPAGTGGDPAWVTSSAESETPPNAAFAASLNKAFQEDQILDSPVIALPPGRNLLTFRHHYDLEQNGEGGEAFDGGVLEIKIGAGSFRDILSAGGSFVTGAYNTRVTDFPLFFTSLRGRRAWGGNSGGFLTTTVNLPDVASGQTVQFRWKVGYDNGRINYGGSEVPAVGWFVDTVRVDNPRADLAVTKSGPAEVTFDGTASYTVTVTNTGPDVASPATLTDTLPAGLGFVSVTPPPGWTCPTTPAVGVPGDISCTRPSLSTADGPQAFTVVARGIAVGPAVNRAEVSSPVRDVDPADNVATVSTNVAKASPSITTMASAGGTVGTASVSDTATVSGGFQPTGTVTFRLFSDATCTTQVFTSTSALSGATATSDSYSPVLAGTYRWTAVYSGDANNNPATSPCNAPNESVTIVKASPTLTTQASADNLVGAPLRDTGTVVGGFNPTGTVTFRLFSDAACATQVFTSAVPVAGGAATSAWFTPAAPGTYRWTAAYSGDANNNAATSPCNAPGESTTLAPFAPPAFTRTLTGDVLGPVTVAADESVLITRARVAGGVIVQPGGALTVEASSISRGLTADRPRFLSVCGTDVAATTPLGVAVTVTAAPVPIRIGDPAAGCAGNRFPGVTLTSNLATTFAANRAAADVTVTSNGPGPTVLKANTVFATLACTGNEPAPTNGGQPNVATAKTGQCAGV